jgi:hypothetical protein
MAFNSIAQNFNLKLEESSIRISNDTLIFKVLLTNLDTIPYVFIALDALPNFNLHNYDTTIKTHQRIGLVVDIRNKKKKLPKKYRQQIGGPSDFTYWFGVEKCSMIKSNECREFNYRVCLWPLDLKRGKYSLVLKYYSDFDNLQNFYTLEYIKKCSNGYKLFYGELVSNTGYFIYNFRTPDLPVINQ